MVKENSKKSPYTKTYKSSKNGIINWWNKQHRKGKFLIAIICCLGLLSIIGLSGALAPDKNTQKIDALNQMEVTLNIAQPLVDDPYTTINAYTSGTTDMNTAVSRLQADKTIINGLISQMQSITPPDELQHSYNVTLSTLEDLSISINLGIDGVKNNDSKKMNQAISVEDNAAAKFNQASNEIYTLRYPTN